MAPPNAFRLDSLKQQFQSGPVHFACRYCVPITDQPPLFEPLCPYAPVGPVEVQDLDLGGLAIDESEQISRQWVLSHAVTRQRVQAIVR
jgi:hypothetical protein